MPLWLTRQNGYTAHRLLSQAPYPSCIRASFLNCGGTLQHGKLIRAMCCRSALRPALIGCRSCYPRVITWYRWMPKYFPRSSVILSGSIVMREFFLHRFLRSSRFPSILHWDLISYSGRTRVPKWAVGSSTILFQYWVMTILFFMINYSIISAKRKVKVFLYIKQNKFVDFFKITIYTIIQWN